MARPKKGQPGYEEANRKWRETMEAKHGSASEFMAKIGRKGGQNGHTGGFAANRELAKIAGAKGGKISTRKGIPNKNGSAKKKGTPPHLTDEDIKVAKKKKGWVWPFSRNAK